MKNTCNNIFKTLLYGLSVAFACSIYPANSTINPAPTNTIVGVPKQLQKLHNEQIALNFNNATLQNIADEISTLFDITFLSDDDIKKSDGTPLAKGLGDHKVTFNTNRILTANQALNLFKTFLELAGFCMISTYDPHVYRITTIDTAQKSPLPTYINTPIDSIPNNDTRIRYVLLVVNNTPKDMKATLDSLKSKQAQIDLFEDLNALIISDKSYNIKGLVEIAKELDTGNMPETLTVLKLKDADAKEVADTIDKLKQKDGQRQPWGGMKKQSTIFYFPTEVKLIPSRNNTLIILGPKEGVRRIESFIVDHIDKKLKINYNILHVYPLNFAMAEPLAEILTELVQFGKAGNEKNVSATQYFSNVFIQAEKQSNSLIIRANKEEYALLVPIIEGLDVQQPQVAIEVLIVDLKVNKGKAWGSQMRSRSDKTVNWQSSGFFNNANSTPILSEDKTSLLGNLLDLVQNLNGALSGSTLLSLGKTSVWALFGILQQTSQSRILSNPFLVSTNKYKASVSLGETRNVATQTITGGTGGDTTGFTEISANLKVTIIPQINEFGVINLDISILIEQFTNADTTVASTNAQSLGDKEIRQVKTVANVADGEVLALGGLIRSTSRAQIWGTPVLQRIPLVGRLFSNQNDNNDKENLVIFIAPKVIQTQQKTSQNYTESKADFLEYQFASFKRDDQGFQPKDPVRKWFFEPDRINQTEETLEFLYSTETKEKAKQEVIDSIIAKDKGLTPHDHDGGTAPTSKDELKQPPDEPKKAPEQPKSAKPDVPAEPKKQSPLFKVADTKELSS